MLVRDEVHLVPALGERDAQVGGDGARASVRRITSDADLHPVPSRVSFHHASARSSALGSRGSMRVTSAGGSWLRNHVRWRLAYWRVAITICSRASDRLISPRDSERTVAYPVAFHAGAVAGTRASSARASSIQPASSMSSNRAARRWPRAGPG